MRPVLCCLLQVYVLAYAINMILVRSDLLSEPYPSSLYNISRPYDYLPIHHPCSNTPWVHVTRDVVTNPSHHHRVVMLAHAQAPAPRAEDYQLPTGLDTAGMARVYEVTSRNVYRTRFAMLTTTTTRRTLREVVTPSAMTVRLVCDTPLERQDELDRASMAQRSVPLREVCGGGASHASDASANPLLTVPGAT